MAVEKPRRKTDGPVRFQRNGKTYEIPRDMTALEWLYLIERKEDELAQYRVRTRKTDIEKDKSER
ncbi:hypothetical protein [Streptomyces sp. NPDC102462]|uniref:hypothetical protein n=1 Tax=Streptomyces sp. NPDC102462 TaxID=3366178 RepID=UPI0037F85643